MGHVKSWECGECTNRTYRNQSVYCTMFLKYGRNRTEWQGDYIECLDKTLEPQQMEMVMGAEE